MCRVNEGMEDSPEAAPERERLVLFGGDLSIEQFRTYSKPPGMKPFKATVKKLKKYSTEEVYHKFGLHVKRI